MTNASAVRTAPTALSAQSALGCLTAVGVDFHAIALIPSIYMIVMIPQNAEIVRAARNALIATIVLIVMIAQNAILV